MKYRGGYKYQLAESEVIILQDIERKDGRILKAPRGYDIDHSFIRLTPDGVLTGKMGYAWDGASGPTIDTKDSMRGSLFHDIGYQLMREGVLPLYFKEYFDNLFFLILVKDGMIEIRAWIWFNAVCDFGESSTLPENDRPILEAP